MLAPSTAELLRPQRSLWANLGQDDSVRISPLFSVISS